MNENDNMNPILRRLFNLMAEKGVNAKRVTETLHMSASSFTDWKKGRASPGLEALSKLAPYFGVSLDYLITGHEFESPDGAKRDDDIPREESASEQANVLKNENANSYGISNPMDAELLAKYHRLPAEYQGKILSYLDGMLAVLPLLQSPAQPQPQPIAQPSPAAPLPSSAEREFPSGSHLEEDLRKLA